MTNVVMLNFCYDVPVKLYSSTLLAVAVVIALPDARRLIACLLGRAAPESTVIARTRFSKRTERIRLVAKLGAIAIANYMLVHDELDARAQYIDTPPGPLDGVYDVVSFTAGGVDHPPLLTDPLRWQRVYVWGNQAVGFAPMTGDTMFMHAEISDHDLVMQGRSGAATLAYTHAGDTLELDGDWKGSKVHAILTRRPEGQTPLETRGFHWVAEFPYNR
jgi:hypothetical protein